MLREMCPLRHLRRFMRAVASDASAQPASWRKSPEVLARSASTLRICSRSAAPAKMSAVNSSSSCLSFSTYLCVKRPEFSWVWGEPRC